MVLLCVQIGDEKIEVEFPDSGGSVYQFKKAIKLENKNEYQNTDARRIVVKDFNGNELANLEDMGYLIAKGTGKLDTPFLVDDLAGMHHRIFIFIPHHS